MQLVLFQGSHDVALIIRPVTQNFSELRDLLGQIAFLDRTVGPNAIQQLVFFHNFAAVLHQGQQSFQWLDESERLHRLGTACAVGYRDETDQTRKRAWIEQLCRCFEEFL